MRLPQPLYDLFGVKKELSGPWLGNPRLNRFGLHAARIALTDAALRLRRSQLALLGSPPELETLERDGVLTISDLLPPEQFAALRAEAHARVAAGALADPAPAVAESRGFGPKRAIAGGFDRFDGDTLNRFFTLTPGTTPRACAVVRDARLAKLCRAASGFRHQPERFALYVTVAGDHARNPDPQRVLHRDTFHSTIKLWLFLDDVAEADGPFVYVPGSHRMSLARYRWELARARKATLGSADRGGSFRVTLPELAELGLPAPRSYPVRANTLVLADTRGFHRRGDATLGAKRLALYANLRSWPFSPVVY
jgi:hypothetical protein